MSVELMNTQDAAKYLDLSESTLTHWRMDGKGPAICKLGKSVRYRVADLERFVEAGVVANEKDRG